MADHSFGNIALAILPMASVATLTGLTTSVNTAQGLVVGVGTTGEGDAAQATRPTSRARARRLMEC